MIEMTLAAGFYLRASSSFIKAIFGFSIAGNMANLHATLPSIMPHPLSLTLEAPNGIKYEQPVGLFIDVFVPAKSGDLIKSICPL